MIMLAGAAWMGALPRAEGAAPRNVILCIGDGMGFAQVDAAGYYLFGDDYLEGDNRVVFQGMPHQARMTTYAADTPVTDSAASGTAMATGHKVNYGVVSMAYPGDGRELETFLELSQQRGQRTGLVTTTFIAHATPATFAAHDNSRYHYAAIIADYLYQSRPDLLFGGAAHVAPLNAQLAGYTVVRNRAELLDLDTAGVQRVWGMFGNDHLPYEFDGLGNLPHLSEMTAVALDVLDNDPDGFFLLVEGGRIDHAGHANDIERLIPEVIAFHQAVETVCAWAAGRSDTLIIVTADHETGGLTVIETGAAGEVPTVSWSTGGHTSALVPVYAWGVNASLVHGVMDNTDIAAIMRRTEMPGDFNDDGMVTAADLPAMIACVTGPALMECCDFNGDSIEDLADLGAWCACLRGPAASWDADCRAMDLDRSHTVDLHDWAVLQQEWPRTNRRGPGSGCAGADFDADNDIDLHDLARFQKAMVGVGTFAAN